MAEMVNFEGANRHIGPPPGAEEFIGHLHCFKNGIVVVSAWKFTPEELADVIANDGVFFMSVRSGDNVFPVFAGSERQVAAVVADEGGIWR